MPSNCCKRDLGTRGLPRPDISGCGECRIALKGSALEVIGNGRTNVAAMHGNTIVARRGSFAVNPSR
jgi:hypothetical protein